MKEAGNFPLTSTIAYFSPDSRELSDSTLMFVGRIPCFDKKNNKIHLNVRFLSSICKKNNEV